MLEVRDLTKYYGEFLAVNSISFEASDGEIFGLLGPNGSGKSTTMRMILGLLKPTAGEIIANGIDVIRERERAKKIMGYVPDDPVLPERLTAWEFVNYIADLRDIKRGEEREKRIDELFDLLDLSDARDDLIESFSRGMRKKLGIIAAILHKPKILVVDELFTGIDPKGATTVKTILKGMAEQGATIIMSTHILEIAEKLCNRIAIIKTGEIIASGTMDELRSTSDENATLEELFLELTGGPDIQKIIDFLEG